MKESNEMSFLGHVEVFRWHLIRSFFAIIFISIIAFIFSDIHGSEIGLPFTYTTITFFPDFFNLIANSNCFPAKLSSALAVFSPAVF